MNQTLRYVIWVGLFVIPFFAFFISGSMLFPFITGKNFAFRIIVEIAAVLWIILALRDSEYMPKRSWILYSALLFLGFMGLADLFGESPHKSFWSNFERMEGFLAHIHFFLYFLVLSSVVFVKKTWDALFGTWVGVSVLMCFFGLVQLSGSAVINQGGNRVDGTFGNATYLAVFLLCNIFLTLFFIVRALDRNKGQLWFLLPALLLQGVILYYTATRGAILGLLGGVILSAILIAFRRGEANGVRKVAIGGLVALTLLIGGFFLVKDSAFVRESPVLSRFASLSVSEIKTQGRFFIWPMALEGISERPVLGWGQENFNYIFNAKYTPAMYSQEQWFDRAHNAPLDWLVAGGILTFIPYVGLFVFFLWYLWKKEGFGLSFAEKSILTGLLAGYFFQSLFVFDNLFSYILFFTVLAYIQSQSEGARLELPAFLKAIPVRNALSVVTVVLFVFVFFIWNVKPMRASMQLIDALRALQTSRMEESLNIFENILDERTLGNTETREQLVTAGQSFLAEGVDQGVRERYATLARLEMNKHILEYPADARAHIFHANLLRNLGLTTLAFESYEKALSLSPNKQSFILEVGATHLAAKNYEEAYKAFKYASDLDPRFEEARIIYAIGALYTGRIEEARTILSGIPDEVLVFDNRLANTYAELKRYTELIALLSARLETERGRENLQNYTSLAIAYSETGNKTKAIEVVQQALLRHPGEKADLEVFLGQIQNR